jgi:peptide/nickel transport system ATP-binding protein
MELKTIQPAGETKATETILSVEKVVKTYADERSLFKRKKENIKALKDVDLSVEKGEVFGLVGASGSGKTTLGRLILRLEIPDAGTIRYHGLDCRALRGKALKAFRRKVQMIPQDPYQSLNPYLSIYDTVAEPLVIHGIGKGSEQEELVRKSLDSCGLIPAEGYFQRYPHQLSGGERQRAAIARAMVLSPEFIVADEPTSMLDASISFTIFELLSDIQKSRSVTFLFITHDLAAARFFCNRIAVINQGEIVESGASETMITDPQTEYTRRLINAQPRFGFVKNR